MFDIINIILKDLFIAKLRQKIILGLKIKHYKYKLFITVYDFDIVSLKLRLMPA